MNETKIENVEATEEIKSEVSEAIEVTEEVEKAEEVVAEGKDACEANEPKEETEDDQNEKKVTVATVKQNLADKKSNAPEITEEEKEEVPAEEVAPVEEKKEEAEEEKEEVEAPAEEEKEEKDVMESLLDIAAEKVSDIMKEAMDKMPIEEGVSREEKEAEIYEHGQKLLNDVMAVLEGMVAGTTMELKGAQVEVKDFVQTGGKVVASATEGINPPSETEDDEHEKKVVIKEYPAHEAEEIDYKSKYAESEAVMDDLVKMVEETASQYTALVEEFNRVATELQAYKLAEEFNATVDECADMLQDFDYEDIREEFIKVISAKQEEISEEKEEVEAPAEEAPAEEVAPVEEKKEEEKEEVPAEEEVEAPAEEEKEEANEEVEEEKSVVDEIQESLENIKDVVISEAEEAPVRKNRAFSVFGGSISESQPSHRGKAFSVFAD